MIYNTIVLVAPTVEPITLSESKDQLRLTALFTADDTYISSLISVARDRAEQYSNRFFTEQAIAINYKGSFPVSVVELPYPDLQSVIVTYVDGDNATQTVDVGDYIFNSELQEITTIAGWPFAKSFRIQAFTSPPVEFEGAKQSMLMMLTDMYELRQETVVGASVAMNEAVRAMLQPYRVNMGI